MVEIDFFLSMKIKLYKILSIAIIAAGIVACSDELSSGSSMIGNSDYINVGGVETNGLVGTVGTDAVVMSRAGEEPEEKHREQAEDVVWLQSALRNGLDITYSNMDADNNHIVGNERVAILKWSGEKNPDSKRGIYSFNYKGTEEKAHWYSNGPHYFEGLHVPAGIRCEEGSTITAQNITRDQSDDSENGNYTLLSHYIGMPPSWTHSATIDQVLLPFKHRLSRVIVYVLIDPLLNTKIKGYNCTINSDGTIATKDDPKTTELRFNSVKVLDHVKEVPATETAAAKLTPIWTNDGGITRKVIPHFIGETSKCVKADGTTLAADDDDAKSSFIVYTKKATDEKFHPRETKWLEAHNAYRANPTGSGYTRSTYVRVPVYDVIVRPTYTANDSVMYDEANYYNADKSKNTTTINALRAEANSIDFEMTLESGLTYSKRFEFDLNANWQTVVYLTVDREGVDYDASTSEKWEQVMGNDGYYGPNNDLGHNLSMAGSSWQRAYRNSRLDVNVTDGNQYGQREDLGQYVSDKAWIEHFAQAYQGGANHGDYFVLDKDITIDASQLPQNFKFTGHLDGRGYTITFTGASDGWAESTLYNEEHLYNTKSESDEFHCPDLYIPVEIAQSKRSRAGIEMGDDMMEKVTDKSLYEIMHDGVDYYYKDGDGYTLFVRPTALYRKNPTSLFAGLNAMYDTPQETNTALDHTLWEANVHWEKNYWVPFKGYRAEILNTKLSGGSFFPVTLPDASVTGYIYYCFEGTAPISNNPAIPEY